MPSKFGRTRKVRFSEAGSGGVRVAWDLASLIFFKASLMKGTEMKQINA